MNISSISDKISLSNLSSSNLKKDDSNESFKDMLDNAVSEVNKEQIQGYNAMEGIATGKVTNLQEAVRQIEEAELSLKLALEVKNKALMAYKEIMSMQI